MALEGLQLGQYRLLRPLGSGGMGEVYLAEDARINQHVAIKVSRSEATPYPHSSTAQDAVRLFQREAKAIARLDHIHILPLFSYGEENVNGMTLIYIVMPYRREGSLSNWLQQRSDNTLLSVQDVVYCISQAADALQYAHENQIVHQDVKPSNFLLRTNKEHPHLPDLLLADFGIAKLSTSTANVSHSIRGTPTYMAPEQWSGEPVYATDQYALAILTYELLAGRPPFSGRQEQLMYQHFSVQPQPPSTFNPQLSKDVDGVILKALAKQPADRFPSISAFAAAFQQATQNLDASTIVKIPTPTPTTSKGKDLHVTLAISKAEALNGTNRILTLPGGRQISVPVPAGAYNGQALRFPGLGEPLYESGPIGTLILTLSVQATDRIAPLSQGSLYDQTLFPSPLNPPDRTVLPSNRSNGSSLPHSSSRQGISTGTAILLVGLAFLMIVGSLGFFYLYNSTRPSSSIANSTTTTPGVSTTDLAATITAQANTATPTAIPTFTATPLSGTYIQLKSSYSGIATASSSAYPSASITFTLESEDAQGNVTMQTLFQQLGGANRKATYSCQGSVTTDRHLSLQCSDATDANFVLTIQGFVYQDGHMEGTETATYTNNPSYHHVYSWTAS